MKHHARQRIKMHVIYHPWQSSVFAQYLKQKDERCAVRKNHKNLLLSAKL